MTSKQQIRKLEALGKTLRKAQEQAASIELSNFSTDIVPGAIEIRYKEKPIGWIGLPVLEMSPALKTWLEKSQEKTSDDEWNSIVQRYAEPSWRSSNISTFTGRQGTDNEAQE